MKKTKTPFLSLSLSLSPSLNATTTVNQTNQSPGELLVLDNVRFYKAETKNEPDFAKALAANAEIYVNDAFGTAHRAHGSTEGVTKYLSPSVAGFCMQKELDYLDGAVAHPKRPFAAIVGGSKVSSKIGVIETLINKVDKIFLGGGMIFTFYKAQGKSVGASLVEEDKLDLARELIALAEKKGVQFILPTDVIVADKFAADANTQVVSIDAIPDGWMGLDIGPESLKAFQAALSDCKQVIWNGPMVRAFFFCSFFFDERVLTAKKTHSFVSRSPQTTEKNTTKTTSRASSRWTPSPRAPTALPRPSPS